MASSHEKLADSLRLLHAKQAAGKKIFTAKDFTRVHQTRLVESGFLSPIIKGWYYASNPTDRAGDSTPWFATFYEFVSTYCQERFGDDWHLSAEASLQHHTGNTVVPKQLIIYSSAGANNNLTLKHDTSLFDYKVESATENTDIVSLFGLRLLSLPAALVRATPTLYNEKPIEMQIALTQLKDVSDVLPHLLVDGKTIVAGRIAGGFRAIGRTVEADQILKSMRAIGHAVSEQNPFSVEPFTILSSRNESPVSIRLRAAWESMRTTVIDSFPQAPTTEFTIEAYLNDVEDRHVEDAYHSLSIEGYEVSEELIEKISSGKWSPEENQNDKENINAMAAKGYHQAFLSVKQSVEKILNHENAGHVAQKDHADWYMQLFAPAVRAGIIEAKHLAGYRSMPVYIRNARHIPPASDAVRDAMPTFFELLKQETEPTVRAVLGHYLFVYIHPYMDGNGRMGRFLMNAMLASGGYPWTVIRVEDRNQYMQALDLASGHNNIQPFSEFIAKCVNNQMSRRNKSGLKLLSS